MKLVVDRVRHRGCWNIRKMVFWGRDFMRVLVTCDCGHDANFSLDLEGMDPLRVEVLLRQDRRGESDELRRWCYMRLGRVTHDAWVRVIQGDCEECGSDECSMTRRDYVCCKCLCESRWCCNFLEGKYRR